jgi:hypothetical protein
MKRGGLAIALLALVCAAFAGALYATHRARNASAACTGCHASGQPKGGHAKTTCQACHRVPSPAAVVLSKLGASLGPHGQLDAAACRHCHEQDPVRFRAVADTEGHRLHAATDCKSCHAGEPHGKASAKVACATCHPPARLHAHTEGADDCLSCHNFEASGDSPATAIACDRCHGADLGRERLHSGVDCKLCHQPHRADARGQACTGCHQIQLDVALVPAGHADCQKCHAPHGSLKNAAASCAQCHEQATAKGGRPTTALGHPGCASCHVTHVWTADRGSCVRCHAAEALSIATKSPAKHGGCGDCHAVHEPKTASSPCAGCHGDKVTLARAAPATHAKCTSCHDPHAASGLAAKAACKACHGAPAERLATQGPAEHREAGCLGCHGPHGAPLASPNVCSRCHADKTKLVLSAKPPKHQACGSCHAQHEFTQAAATGACAGCHEGPAAGEVHRGECKKCHTPHGSPAVTRSACLDCHKDVAAAARGPTPTQHATCSSCHEAHRPAQVALERCKTCHEDKIRLASSWPASSPHAGACAGCHKPHAVRDIKPCADCHGAETGASKGDRHKCAQCHKPHEAMPAGGAAGFWNKCSGCHAGESKGASVRGETHRDCKNCHKPHGFTPPTCTSCHADIGGKAAHSVKEHGACNKCHDAHVSAPPTRTQCLSCHADKANHEPAVPRCQSCHPFR